MKSRPWLPYVAPMAIYLTFLSVQSNDNLVWLNPLKTLTVTVALWWFRREYTELRPAMSWLGVAVGLVAIAFWIFADRLYPKVDELLLSFEQLLRRLFNSRPPKATLTPPFDPSGRWAFITFRIVGAVLVVPVMVNPGYKPASVAAS